MMKIYLSIIIAFLFIGCNKDSSDDTNETSLKKSCIIVSQDSFDRDNYSIATVATELDKRGVINFVALDITGKDTNGGSSLVYSTLVDFSKTKIFINHAPDLDTRVTPSTQRYFPYILNFKNDGLMDAQREDSTVGLKEVFESCKDVTYVVGGHLHNLAYLLKEDKELVKQKLKLLVIGTGWRDRTSGKPEMNLSEGLYRESGTSEATKYVFAHLPKSVKVVIPSDPDVHTKEFDPNAVLRGESPLLYIQEHGTYPSKTMSMGDFEALFYATYKNTYNGKTLSREVKTCFHINNYGAVTVGSGDCNHYYLDDVNIKLYDEVFENLLYYSKEGKSGNS